LSMVCKFLYFCNNVVFLKLTAYRKYRFPSALLLLLLYTFTATPVQYWHKHNFQPVTLNYTGDYNAEIDDSAISSNCSVCSHEYSIGYNDSISLFCTANCFYTNYSVLIAPIIPEACNFGLSNKSPPVI
jgi:hypothetical protein